MQKKILVCLDRLKHPYSGLGRVSQDFATTLTLDKSFDYSFLVPTKGDYPFLKERHTIPITFSKKLTSCYMRNFDLVHIPHQLPSYPSNKASKKVITIHDLNFLYTKNSKKKEKYRKRVQSVVSSSDAIVFISNFTQQDCFNNLNLGNQITKVIHNGVIPLQQPSVKPSWCPNSPFLFSIGVFLDKKNFHTLLPFLKQITKEYKLIIAGDNNSQYGNFIRSEIQRLGLKDRVVLSGTIQEEQKSYLYHNCEAFVFPSIAEGFGLPIIEAMGAGKPVFCSNRTSLKEIGSEFAYFWEEFTPSYMADVFDKGVTNFKDNTVHKKNQIKYAESFTWQKNAEEHVKLYNAILS